MFKSGLHPMAYLAVAEKVVGFIGEITAALRDHKLTSEEAQRIGASFVDAVVAAYHASTGK